MSHDKKYMPQSTAGLIRYFDDAEESIKLKPHHVVYISIGIVAAELVLKLLL